MLLSQIVQNATQSFIISLQDLHASRKHQPIFRTPYCLRRWTIPMRVARMLARLLAALVQNSSLSGLQLIRKASSKPLCWEIPPDVTSCMFPSSEIDSRRCCTYEDRTLLLLDSRASSIFFPLLEPGVLAMKSPIDFKGLFGYCWS
jgi:hypothetical protein